MGKTILVSFHPPFLPVLKKLSQMGHVFVTVHPQFTAQLHNLEIPAKSLAEFGDPSLQAVSFTEAARLLLSISQPRNSFEPGALDFMQKGLHGFLYPRLTDLVFFVLALDRVKPDLLLLHNDVEPLNRVAALWAKERGVPILHVPHAVYLDIEKGNPGDDVHDLVTASHIAVAGWFQRDWYRQRSKAVKIAQTGLPQFDRMAIIPKDPLLARRMLGLEPNRPVVTYASSWRQETNLLGCHDGVQETFQAILEVIRRLPEFQFVIKLHPRDQAGGWHQQMADQAGVACLMTAAHTEVVLQASDVLLTYSGSNLILEGSFIPWLRLMATQGYENDPEVLKVQTDPPNPEIITQAILSALKMPPANMTAFQSKYLGYTDGRNVERITALIEGGL